MQAVKLCTDRILQFLTGGARLVDVCNGRKTVVVVVCSTARVCSCPSCVVLCCVFGGSLGYKHMQRAMNDAVLHCICGL